MIKYQYQVLRYQPDKVGEEFMNLGVVAFDPEAKEVGMRHLDSVKRLSAFFPAGNNTYIKSMVKALAEAMEQVNDRVKSELDLAGVSELSGVTRQLLPNRDSALYFSEVRTGVGVGLNDALDDLYDRMVTRYLHSEEKSITDKEVWGRVYREHFRKYNIENKLVRREVVTPHLVFNFEHSWQNGHVNCLETVNFDLKHDPSIREKVQKWLGKLMLLRQASEDLHIYLLSQLPADPELRKFIREVLAEAADPSLKVEVVDETKAEEKVKELAEEMEAHG